MAEQRSIIKASGEQEAFNPEKFRRSLHRAGADPALIAQLEQQVHQMPELKTTRQIYDFALDQLQKHSNAIAGRYTLKRALFALGPAGFSFEKFVSMVFKEQGYSVQTNVIMQGQCVEHEVDVVLHKDTTRAIVECKFHNSQGLKTDVKIPLYVKSRFDDITQASNGTQRDIRTAWIATNTKFTTQAITYAQCVNLNLLGWSYPARNNLQDLIEQYGLHPITSLVSLKTKQKEALIENNIVLCRDIAQQQGKMKELGIRPGDLEKLLQEARAVCRVG